MAEKQRFLFFPRLMQLLCEDFQLMVSRNKTISVQMLPVPQGCIFDKEFTD